MIGFRLRKIRSKFLVWLLSLALIPLFTTLFISYRQSVKTINAKTYTKLIAIRDLKAQRINEWVNECKSDINIYSEGLTTYYAKNQLKGNTVDSSKEIEGIVHLKSFTNNHAYHGASIIDAATGKELLTTNNTINNHDFDNSKLINDVLNTKKVSFQNIYYSQQFSNFTVSIATPIFGINVDTNHINSILVVHVNLDSSLYKILNNKVGLGKTGETLIVDTNAMVLSELRWYANAPLKLKIKAKPAEQAAKGRTGLAYTNDYRGVPVLAAYTYLPQLGWGLVCKQDVQELNAPIKKLLRIYMLITLITILITTYLAILISKTISQPILKMNEVAQQIKAGNLLARNSITSNDELGQLAIEFNSMSDIILSKLTIQNGVANIYKKMLGITQIQDFANQLLAIVSDYVKVDFSSFYIFKDYEDVFEPIVSHGISLYELNELANSWVINDCSLLNLELNQVKLTNYQTEIVFKTADNFPFQSNQNMVLMPINVNGVTVALVILILNTQINTDSFEIVKQAWLSINTLYRSVLANERTEVLAEHLARFNNQLESQADELVQKNRILKQQQVAIEESARLKGEFLSNVSHELKTPLNAINVLSQILSSKAESNLSAEDKNYLTIIERNGKLLLELINEILDLSKIEAGKMNVNIKSLNIQAIIEDVSESLKPMALNKNIHINTEILEPIPKIESDELRLNQIFTNILSNAIKFTENGYIHILLKANTKMVSVVIEDSGIGIPNEMLPYIFDEFRQVDGSTTRKYEGVGLGLAIAKKLVDLLHGKIKVESKLGQGTTFTIELPINDYLL